MTFIGAFLSVFALSGLLAFGLDQAIASGLNTHLGADESALVQTQGTLDSFATPPTEAGTRSIILTSVDSQGAPVTLLCSTPAGLFDVDALELTHTDLGRVAAQLQCHPRSSSTSVG
jgi:hypothetical protein